MIFFALQSWKLALTFQSSTKASALIFRPIPPPTSRSTPKAHSTSRSTSTPVYMYSKPTGGRFCRWEISLENINPISRENSNVKRVLVYMKSCTPLLYKGPTIFVFWGGAWISCSVIYYAFFLQYVQRHIYRWKGEIEAVNFIVAKQLKKTHTLPNGVGLRHVYLLYLQLIVTFSSDIVLCININYTIIRFTNYTLPPPQINSFRRIKGLNILQIHLQDRSSH